MYLNASHNHGRKSGRNHRGERGTPAEGDAASSPHPSSAPFAGSGGASLSFPECLPSPAWNAASSAQKRQGRKVRGPPGVSEFLSPAAAPTPPPQRMQRRRERPRQRGGFIFSTRELVFHFWLKKKITAHLHLSLEHPKSVFSAGSDFHLFLLFVSSP